MRALCVAVSLALAIAWDGAGRAAAVDAAGPALDARLKKLETELRCLVCQNQTLADSNASLAEDLRKEVLELAVSGKSDDEIRAYLVARYGDFVLYDPPLKRTTTLLWIGPFALLALGGVLWWVIPRRRAARAAFVPAGATLPETERRARALLEEATADDATAEGSVSPDHRAGAAETRSRDAHDA